MNLLTKYARDRLDSYVRGYEQGYEYAQQEAQDPADPRDGSSRGSHGSPGASPLRCASPLDTASPRPDDAGAEGEGEEKEERAPRWRMGRRVHHHVYEVNPELASEDHERWVGSFARPEDALLAVAAANAWDGSDDELVQQGMVIALKAAADDFESSGQYHAANILRQRSSGIERSTIRRLA